MRGAEWLVGCDGAQGATTASESRTAQHLVMGNRSRLSTAAGLSGRWLFSDQAPPPTLTFFAWLEVACFSRSCFWPAFCPESLAAVPPAAAPPPRDSRWPLPSETKPECARPPEGAGAPPKLSAGGGN